MGYPIVKDPEILKEFREDEKDSKKSESNSA
jgi:hypothetical protein